MTDINQKALALIAEVNNERGIPVPDYLSARAALIRAIEQHEAFRQEVSDAVEKLLSWPSIRSQGIVVDNLARFINAKPDPLEEALNSAPYLSSAKETAAHIRAALAARGLKIVEAGE